jgi:hypothetical protein
MFLNNILESVLDNKPDRLIVVIIRVSGMRLLLAGASIPLDQVDTESSCLPGHHLPPVENYLRIVVAHLIEVH